MEGRDNQKVLRALWAELHLNQQRQNTSLQEKIASSRWTDGQTARGIHPTHLYLRGCCYAVHKQS